MPAAAVSSALERLMVRITLLSSKPRGLIIPPPLFVLPWSHPNQGPFPIGELPMEDPRRYTSSNRPKLPRSLPGYILTLALTLSECDFYVSVFSVG